MKIFLLSSLILLSTLLISSCKKDNPPIAPPEEQPQVNLTLEDVSCTEAWLKLKSSNISLPAEISLKQDDSTVQYINLSSPDTLLYIDSLLLDHTYKFHSTIQSISQASNSLNVTTMDTTSHNFTWQTFTFGDRNYGSSTLYDVAIIDENNIWAVGEIYNNSTGTFYNAVHWDGNQWELKRILYDGSIWSIGTIFGFSENDICFSAFVKYDGQNFIELPIPGILMGWSPIKMWGSSSSNLYVVGNNGNIAYYNGQSWQGIASGTTTNINDIWGIDDPSTGNSLVLCTVTNRYHSGDHKLLSISGDRANEYITWPYTGLYGIWFNSTRNIYIVGGGAYVYKNENLKTFNVPSSYYLTRVKGNNLNDIYIATAGAEILHFNGMNWAGMSEGIYGKYEGLDVKGNTVALVGYNIEGGMVGKAVVTIGKHFR